jgi:hypothetical protein
VDGSSVTDPPFLTRVVLHNYKSIAACDVRLGSLTFLVGPNGSGKSNFLDALHFVADALRTTLEHAIRKRGGINEVRYRSANRASYISMRLEFQLPGVSLPGSRLETHPPVRISFSAGKRSGPVVAG